MSKKQLIIFVPESATIDHRRYDARIFTRAEIIELVRNHADNLGYRIPEDVQWWDEAEFIALCSNGDVFLGSKNYFIAPSRENFQEISPFDFLKLTPGDVNIESVNKEICNQCGCLVSGSETRIHNGKCMKCAHGIKSTTTDRNEKAWDMLKVIVASRPHDPSQRLVNITEAIDYADDFIRISNASIKQTGNK